MHQIAMIWTNQAFWIFSYKIQTLPREMQTASLRSVIVCGSYFLLNNNVRNRTMLSDICLRLLILRDFRFATLENKCYSLRAAYCFNSTCPFSLYCIYASLVCHLSVLHTCIMSISQDYRIPKICWHQIEGKWRIFTILKVSSRPYMYRVETFLADLHEA